MRKLKFLERVEFDYGGGLVVHEAGDVVAVHEGHGPTVAAKDGEASIRLDKAQRWVSRNVADFVETTQAATAPSPSKESDDDNPVGGAKDVAGADGGDSGKRPVDVEPPAAPAAAPAPVAKPAAAKKAKHGRR